MYLCFNIFFEQRKYYVRVPKTQFGQKEMVHYYVSIDEQEETKMIALKDPVMFHIQNIIMIDYKQENM